MYIFLPVKVYDKSSNVPFSVDINNDTLVINTTNNVKVHEIILCNFSYGITTIPVSFPLTFLIVKNELICDQFYIFKVLSTNNEFDFLNVMINEVNKKFNKKYTLYKNMNFMNLINLLKLHSNNDNNDSNDINKIYYRVCRYLNFCLATIADGNISNIADTSKILQIINLIKQIKMSFYGNTTNIEEHIEFINNPNLIKKKRYYFYENNNKIIKIYIKSDGCDNINKTDLKPYPNKYNKLITIKNLLNTLIINHFEKLFDISCRVLYKKKQNIIIQVNSHIFDNQNYIELEIANGNYDKLHELSFDKYKLIIDNNNNLNSQNIINSLLETNIFPINYDKRTLNDNFIKILYLLIKNEEYIQHINHKLKSIFIYILKIYKCLSNDDFSIINNSRIYNETLIYQIIKSLLFNNHILLNDVKFLSNIKQKFINNIIIIQILTNLSWKTISKQLSLFKYLISNRTNCKDLIIVDGKLNKTYTNNMDNRLKKIIVDPLQMFNYLKKEEDFYKWMFNFKELIPRIFYNMITLEGTDYKKLAKILFNYSRIKNQNMEDENYKKLLYVLKIDSKLVLFNDRINIKFKDIFKNININLGFMARDIVNEEIISITISEDITDNNHITSNINIDTIHKLKRKYYKYKGKYLEMKLSETINENI